MQQQASHVHKTTTTRLTPAATASIPPLQTMLMAPADGTCYSANNQHALQQQAALYGSAAAGPAGAHGASDRMPSSNGDGRLPHLGRSMSMDIATALNARVASPYQQQPPPYSHHQQQLQGYHGTNGSAYQQHDVSFAGNGSGAGSGYGYYGGSGYQQANSNRLSPMLEFGGLHGSMMSGTGGSPPYGTVYDMKSLTSALAGIQSGTGDVQRVLQSSTFRPRLPGLTKLVSQLSREGQWAKALEVYEALGLIALHPDTTITNAAISACDKGGQWEKALAVFHSMDAKHLPRDAITYSAVISALAKGRQWSLAIDVFNHMAAAGIECDAVTCCSLITALDKGGQWQLAEEVFMQLYADHPQLSALLRCLKDDAASLPPLHGAAGPARTDGGALTGLAAAMQHMSLGAERAGVAAVAAGVSAPGAAGVAGAAEGGMLSYPPSPMPTMPQRRVPSGDLLQMSTSSLLSMQSSEEADLSSHLLPSVAEHGVPSNAQGGPTPSSGGLPPLPPGLGGSSGGGSAVGSAQGQVPVTVADGSIAGGSLLGPHANGPHTLHRSISEPMGIEQHHHQQMSLASTMYSPYSAITQSPLASSGSRLMRAGSLNSKKSAPHRVCCNALLAAYARAVPPQWGKAVKLLELMWRCGGELCPDIVSYNTVMKACGNAHQIGLAFELYQVMRSRGVEASVATFGTLISIASDAQAYARVKEAWAWLQASGLPVHITCVNSYMSALVKEDNWDVALQLFDSLKMQGSCVKPNTITFNILMSGCLAKEQPAKVKQLFDEMLNGGLAPTTVTFNNLINAYGKMGQWQEAVQVLGCLCRPNSSAKPVATTFNAVFATLRDAALTAPDQQLPALRSRATSTYALLQGQPGIVPDATLYKNMIAAFFNCGDVGTVLQLLTAMLQQGLAVDQATVEFAVAALEAARAWDLAPQLLAACCESGVRPALGSLQGLLVACARDGAWQAAYSIVTTCGQLGQLESVVSGLKDAGQCELLFLVLLQGKRATGAWKDALDLFQLMRRMQPSFATANGALYGALLELLVGAGGAAGLLEAVGLCSEAHAGGAMTHYLAAGAAQPGSPGSNTGANTNDAAPTDKDDQAPTVHQDTLRALDVSSCSATEAVVLLLSWLGQILDLHACGIKLPSPILEVTTDFVRTAGPATTALNSETGAGAAAASSAAHSAVAAVLQGQLPVLLCVSPGDMAAQFEAAGRGALGRLACVGVPYCLSDEPVCNVLLLAEDVPRVAAQDSAPPAGQERQDA